MFLRNKMYTRKKSLDIPDSFQFPFQPYDIQNGFMRGLYSVLENGKIGIFESPTGKFLTYSLGLNQNADHQ